MLASGRVLHPLEVPCNSMPALQLVPRPSKVYGNLWYRYKFTIVDRYAKNISCAIIWIYMYIYIYSIIYIYILYSIIFPSFFCEATVNSDFCFTNMTAFFSCERRLPKRRQDKLETGNWKQVRIKSDGQWGNETLNYMHWYIYTCSWLNK